MNSHCFQIRFESFIELRISYFETTWAKLTKVKSVQLRSKFDRQTQNVFTTYDPEKLL